MLFQGRAALSKSLLSLFEMIIRPCGITDAGVEGGRDRGMDGWIQNDVGMGWWIKNRRVDASVIEG